MSDCAFSDCGRPIEKLSSDEKTEIPALPHVSVPAGTSLDSCDYNLILKYQIHIAWLKKVLTKRWRVELRNTGSEFAWQISMR